MNVILFDLDGTLVDTAHDLGIALNRQLKSYGKPALTYDEIRPVASHGSKGLLALGFGISPSDYNFEKMRTEYLNLYENVFTNQPVLLPGIAYLLEKLDLHAVKWGIVTNKPRRFAVDLVKATQLNGASLYDRAGCLVCGDDAPQPKPAPDTLLMASKKMNCKPEDCIYVGDAERDVQAGRAARMKTIVALFGYIASTDQPGKWGADAMIKEPLALLNYLN